MQPFNPRSSAGSGVTARPHWVCGWRGIADFAGRLAASAACSPLCKEHFLDESGTVGVVDGPAWCSRWCRKRGEGPGCAARREAGGASVSLPPRLKRALCWPLQVCRVQLLDNTHGVCLVDKEYRWFVDTTPQGVASVVRALVRFTASLHSTGASSDASAVMLRALPTPCRAQACKGRRLHTLCHLLAVTGRSAWP